MDLNQNIPQQPMAPIEDGGTLPFPLPQGEEAPIPQEVPEGEISEEQRQELLQKLEELKGISGQINTGMFINKNTKETDQQALQKQIFLMLQELGVDLSDPNSIREFLSKLETENPDIFELINGLLTDAFAETGEPMPSQLAEGVPMSGQQPEELKGILSQL